MSIFANFHMQNSILTLASCTNLFWWRWKPTSFMIINLLRVHVANHGLRIRNLIPNRLSCIIEFYTHTHGHALLLIIMDPESGLLILSPKILGLLIIIFLKNRYISYHKWITPMIKWCHLDFSNNINNVKYEFLNHSFHIKQKQIKC